jgi:hypothetical protein
MPVEKQFNLEDLRLTQDFDQNPLEKEKKISILVRRPDHQVFVRFHPDDKYHFKTLVLEIKEKKEYYLISPELRPNLENELRAKLLALGITRQGSLFIWPISIGNSSGDTYSPTALDLVIAGKTRWCRIIPNLGTKVYEPIFPKSQLPDPEWPDLQIDEILNIAFKDHFIDSEDHPIIRNLLGKE